MTRRRAYSLDQCPLYKLSSRKRLAYQVFGIEPLKLQRLAANGDSNYRVFEVDQGGKPRQVETPKPILERVHRRLFVLLDRIEKPGYLHSGVKGRSYITNARAHLGHVPVVKTDIKKFYPSVNGARVFRFFADVMRCSPDVSAILTKLTTLEDHIPTGSCVSQALAFFAVRPMFDDLHELAMQHNVCLTVYVDDMTFSGFQASPALLWRVKQSIHSHGFDYHKDRVYTADQQKLVTGVLLDGDEAKVLPSREHEMWLRFHALSGGDIEERQTAIARLIGSVMAAGQIEPRFKSRVRRLKAMQEVLKELAR